ncbi:OmpP1/FadL family transporter [Paraferrimonas sedimenticola]|uniref:Long-chain fatty acid transporter n=1 Tax=Paraferrimonas sedimenticola TaxID=375674 RepID=A0AA37RV05_9GAMM|nr:outer membrane protein transport protein [Paraferrimonas sedimenticola]GLP95369.1 long-chain fatty acid transporter [Paraferrimonas sedimenticola]
MKQFARISTLAAAVMASTSVSAAGFQVTTHSAAGNGRANAGEAVIADNASVLARNPAAMTRFKEASFSGGLNVIDPRTQLTDIKSTGSLGSEANIPNQSGVTATTPVPNLYYIQPVNDRLAVGFAAFSNFGTTSEFSKAFNEADEGRAGMFGGKTRVMTANLNASVAYKLTDKFSLGMGVNAIYGEGEFTRQGNVDMIINVPTNLQFEGNGWSYNLDVGAMYEINEDHRFGLSYRSGTKFEAKGKGDFNSGGVVDESLSRLNLNLPAIAEFSGYHKLTGKFAVHYSLQWTGWSAFDKIDFIGTDPEFVYPKEYNWKDSYRAAIGATYDLNDSWTLRAGIARDDSPIPADKRVISIPDSNRIWYSAGATYHMSDKSSIDAGFTFIDGEKTPISESLGGTTMTAITQTDAVIIGVSYNRSF